jgi:hypothetical protein
MLKVIKTFAILIASASAEAIPNEGHQHFLDLRTDCGAIPKTSYEE